MKRFTPYEGSHPYIFISYSRVDNEIMLNTMNIVRDAEYRLWYDEGIPAGEDWPRYISDHLKSSSAVIFFLSAGSMVSPNCYSELLTASELHIPIICVALDKSAEIVMTAVREKRALKPDEEKEIAERNAGFAARRRSSVKQPFAKNWVDALEGAQFVAGSGEEQKLAERILSSDIVSSKFKGDYQNKLRARSIFNGWAALLLLGFILLVVLLYTGYKTYRKIQTENEMQAAITPEVTAPTPVPTIELGSIPGFTDEVKVPDNKLGTAIREALQKDTEDAVTGTELATVKYLGICGKSVIAQDTQFSFSDGEWYLGGKDEKPVKVIKGNVSDLSVIGKMYYLEELTLVDQNINSVKSLKDLQLLHSLNIAGNPITYLDLENGFLSLAILDISHTNITDLTKLNASAALKTVYVSVDMLPSLVLDENAAYEVVLKR